MLKTTYDKRITPAFVFECAKFGDVHVSSAQVTISSETGSLDLKELRIPKDFWIEYIGKRNERGVFVTLSCNERNLEY